MKDKNLQIYHCLRARVADFIAEADALQAANAETRGIPADTELQEYRSKVLNDCFNLVLIGAFQSGKSTFFDYLCGGREVSPIGCGVRTSGCRVSAHYVDSAAEERAVLAWRSPADLLQGMGDVLVPEYAREDGPSGPWLTEDDVNLADARAREKLAKVAWKELKNVLRDAAFIEGSPKELLRFALLVSRFYPDFEQRCKCGTTETTFEEATKLISYPIDWEPMWAEAMRERSLAHFSPQDVGFAFVGAVDFFIHAPMLRQLGCSVTDSPGLFISEWDTAIAQKCMRQADAVLFSLNGKKTMELEELNVLKHCIATGAQDKLIMGANVKIAASAWEGLQQSIKADVLSKEGMGETVIHPYNAALALRALEHRELLAESAAPETTQAIDDMMLLDELEPPFSHERRLHYLEERINSTMQVYMGETMQWSNYPVAEAAAVHERLDECSGAPAFIAAANSIIAPRKTRSMLIKQGMKPALSTLRRLMEDSRARMDFLTSDIETKQKKLDGLVADMAQFEMAGKDAVDELWKAAGDAKKEIGDYYYNQAGQMFDARQGEIAGVIQDHLPSRLTAIFRNKVKLCQDFQRSIEPKFHNILKDLRDDVARTFKARPGFGEFRREFENQRNALRARAADLTNLPPIRDMDTELEEDYESAAKQMALKSWEIFSRMVYERANIWAFLWGIINIPGWFANKWVQANAVLNANRQEFHQMLGESIKAALDSEKAPFQKIDANVLSFAAAIEKSIRNFQVTRREMEADLHKATDFQGLIDAMGGQVEQAQALCRKGEGLVADCEAFCAVEAATEESHGGKSSQ